MNGFYTPNGYHSKNQPILTESMEDYLEMIFRYDLANQYVRINTLASTLHVKPSSASKMAANLKKNGLIKFEKYGDIQLTEKGREVGSYLLHRHEVLNKLFCCINHSQSELEQVEQIEHYIDKQTIENIEKWIEEFFSKPTDEIGSFHK